jgi:Tfp pilus assembly protein PilV
MNDPAGAPAGPSGARSRAAFTLLEVMIAMAIFFMAIFAILGLVAQNLQVARGLSMGEVDFSTVAAELALTNRLDEGTTTGDFGDYYPGATWTANVSLYSSNGLYQADILVEWPQNGLTKEQHTSILLYRPDSRVRSNVIRR